MNVKVIISSFVLSVCFLLGTMPVKGQDRLPVREYTNPDEVITFDRSTPFIRALDVINQFAQKYAGKIIIDRTETTGSVGITIPPMHWRDALELMLEAKYLQLIERRDYFEIVPARGQTTQAVAGGQQRAAMLPDTAITTESKEVRINAIFFEGNRRALQEIGVDWSTLTENVPDNLGSFVNQQQGGSGGGGGGGGGGGQGGGQQGQLPDVNNFDGPFVSVNNKGAQSVSQNVFNSVINFGDVFGSGISVQALFSAFEADNLGEILASPSVKVLEGEEGHIQVGQDFSIKQRDFAGNVTDQFFSVGTILNVTPQIIEQEDTTFIHLDIEAERSSAQPDPVSTIINKQNATTQALLLNHEATVIAGLYRTEASEVRRGIPILKDLPAWFFGLRYIFGYNSKDYQTRELVIIIQASIEPGIEDRMRRDRIPDKFEILKQERKRIQNDIKRYRDSGKDDVTPVRGEIDSLESEDMRDDEMSSVDAAPDGINKADKAELRNKVEALEQELQDMRQQQIAYRQSSESETGKSIANGSKSSIEKDSPQAGRPEMERGITETPDKSDKATDEQQGEPSVTEEEPIAQDTSPASSGTFKNIDGSDGAYNYYVIAGSFKNENNAQSLLNKLLDEGYNAQVLKKEAQSFYMVAYSGYKRWEYAKDAYDEIRSGDNDKAWIYKMES